jgi:hypothetical protein
MSANLQPIPLGLIGIKPYLEFVVEKITGTSPIEPGENTLQDDIFENPPTVYIDGILLTYLTLSDRRYISFDGSTKTITINNAPVNDGEVVQIFL